MDEQTDTLLLETVRRDGNKVTVQATHLGALVYSDTLDPANAARRKQFIKGLREKIPVADEQALDAELLGIASTLASATHAEANSPTGALLEEMPEDIRTEADAMLADPLLIKRVIDDVAALGVAGERELTATVFLIGTSRLLDSPLSGIVQGPSASGKSYLIETTAALFPTEAVIHATQMTPQALFHMKPGALSHRFIVAGERSRIQDDEHAEGTRALREMKSSGKLSKLMPMKVEGGRIETVLIEQDGPIAHIESTTLTKIFDEDENRCILLHTDEQPAQTRRIIAKVAADATGSAAHGAGKRIIQRHYALQRMLRGMPVVIPFADRLGELFKSDRVEIRRAFPQLLSMIRAVVLLHQRQRKTDEDGRLIAIQDDYQLARHLLIKPMGRLLGGSISDPARRFYDRLKTWAFDSFTSTEAKVKETNSKSAVYGWLAVLHEAGLLEMVAAPRGRSPATWRLTSASPDDAAATGLPTLEDVFPDAAWIHGRNPQVVPVS